MGGQPNYYFEKFNHSLEREESVFLSLKDKNGKRNYEFTIYFNEQIYLFSSFKNMGNENTSEILHC